MSRPVLTLFYDGNCPFCTAEMARLRSWDRSAKLAFVDIAQPGFDPASLGVSMADLNRELHSQTASGAVLVGIDSMLTAYTLVGKAWMVLPLRVTWLRPTLAKWYRAFARNRYRISRWLGYKPVPHCDGNVCRAENPFLKLRDR